jgi:flagellar motility protein MotE (MotC chaperone)
MESASGVTLEKTMVATGIKRFVCCLAVSASLSLVPAFAAGEPDKAPPPGTPSPSPAKPAQGMPKPGEAKLDAKSDPAAPNPPAPMPVKTVTAKTGNAGDDALTGEASANVRKYCTNIAAAATDARFAWQSKKLQELESQIQSRIAELDAKQAELKSLLDKHEAVAKQARETLVGIYSKMKPETAATQIGALDDDMATAVLAALSPRQASAIFDEITPPERAAKLAGMLANPLAPPANKKL